jgi:hypothetical protein
MYDSGFKNMPQIWHILHLVKNLNQICHYLLQIVLLRRISDAVSTSKETWCRHTYGVSTSRTDSWCSNSHNRANMHTCSDAQNKKYITLLCFRNDALLNAICYLVREFNDTVQTPLCLHVGWRKWHSSITYIYKVWMASSIPFLNFCLCRLRMALQIMSAYAIDCQ